MRRLCRDRPGRTFLQRGEHGRQRVDQILGDQARPDPARAAAPCSQHRRRRRREGRHALRQEPERPCRRERRPMPAVASSGGASSLIAGAPVGRGDHRVGCP